MRLLEDVINHLVIHEAMIDDEGGSPIARYKEILEETTEGRYRSIEDPVDRTVSLIFKLVLEHQFDPWDIDLLRFCELYLERVRQEESVDLISSGRILLMAWNILKMQTESALERATPPEIEEEDWDFGIDLWDSESDFEFTQTVRKERDAPIQPRVFRKGERPVTLVELVDAFRDATEEAEKHRIAFERRRKNMIKLKRFRERSIRKMIHKEDLVEDISRVWTRINAFNGHPIPITELNKEDDILMVFMAVLFLAHDGKVKISQKDFPFGMIYVQNRMVQKQERPLPT